MAHDRDPVLVDDPAGASLASDTAAMIEIVASGPTLSCGDCPKTT
jgi:hypothetical protein